MDKISRAPPVGKIGTKIEKLDSGVINDLGASVAKLQETMDGFMKAEEEAGSVIDKLLPTVTKIQKSVESQEKEKRSSFANGLPLSSFLKTRA